MKTNDKTLADAQPGGRVRLGDQLPPLPYTHYNACGDGSEPLYTAEQMQDHARAALAARQQVGEPVAEVSRETFSSDGTSDIIKPNLPIGTKLYATPPAQAVDLGLQLDRYDAGLLGDGGGGDVGWWQDYIRTELDRAHEFYQDQADSQAVGK